jgi:hypothetical protein
MNHEMLAAARKRMVQEQLCGMAPRILAAMSKVPRHEFALPDTSFLCAFYRRQDNSLAAAAHAATMKEPLPVTALLACEFRQSLRFQVWRHAANPREGMTPAEAQAALNQFEADVANGVTVLAPRNFPNATRWPAGIAVLMFSMWRRRCTWVPGNF